MGCIDMLHMAPCLTGLRYGAAMPAPDLNLLFTLDVLLQEGSVAGAARRLRLSASAMSRALARLRETTGDPLLVRAGRGLVPTPRALALREQVRQLVQDSVEVLQPAEVLNLQQLQRTFTLRNREGFVENFGAALVDLVAAQAPGVRLRFEQKTERDSAALRDGLADLETGVVGRTWRRSCGRRRCSATGLSRWCVRGTRWPASFTNCRPTSRAGTSAWPIARAGRKAWTWRWNVWGCGARWT
jgi:DNA-binding transcriptional LysR family regulator